MTLWLDQLQRAIDGRVTLVQVSVARIRGSAPREPGATMVVTHSEVLGTVGGGNLEFVAIDHARRILDGSATSLPGGEYKEFVLGTDLGQCCGGSAHLHFQAFGPDRPDWFEYLNSHRERGEPATLITGFTHDPSAWAVVTQDHVQASRPVAAVPEGAELKEAVLEARRRLQSRHAREDLVWSPSGQRPRRSESPDWVLMRPMVGGDFQLLLFGAGHVGRALVQVLEPLLDRIIWSDSRPNEFPIPLPPKVQAETGDPFKLIDAMPAGAFYLVMTHSHALDLTLCEAVLQRRDHGYLGLIGSASKRKRFEKHLLEEGLTKEDLARLTSPIGVEGIHSKQPSVIAVAVAAQLLQVREQQLAR